MLVPHNGTITLPQSQHGHFGCFWSPADSRQVTWQFTMVQVGVSFSCFRLSSVLPPFLLVCSSCSLCLSSLSSLCVACLLFFLLFFVCLPPLLLFLVFVFLFSALLALFACLLSPLSFLLSYFLRTGCCDNNKGKSTRTEKQTEKNN